MLHLETNVTVRSRYYSNVAGAYLSHGSSCFSSSVSQPVLGHLPAVENVLKSLQGSYASTNGSMGNIVLDWILQDRLLHADCSRTNYMH